MLCLVVSVVPVFPLTYPWMNRFKQFWIIHKVVVGDPKSAIMRQKRAQNVLGLASDVIFNILTDPTKCFGLGERGRIEIQRFPVLQGEP